MLYYFLFFNLYFMTSQSQSREHISVWLYFLKALFSSELLNASLLPQAYRGLTAYRRLTAVTAGFSSAALQELPATS